MITLATNAQHPMGALKRLDMWRVALHEFFCSAIILSMTNQFSGDVQRLIAKFFFDGSGPSHSSLTTAFIGVGFGPEEDDYQRGVQGINKQRRVTNALSFADRRGKLRPLIENLLSELRVDGAFGKVDNKSEQLVAQLRTAFLRSGWTLDKDGHLSPLGSIDLDTAGRPALEDQLARLQRNSEDPGLQIGTAKELLEAVAKFVLEAASMGEAAHKMDFQPLIGLAIERLDLHPKTVDSNLPGGRAVREVRQAARQVAIAVNELRNAQGTGHGRTLPTGVSPEMARYVAREAASLADWLLSELKTQYGQ
ncbi:abortive infection family protein [Jonesia quinghaiensis]|uniref:abortive infection family protein n=1 Tax=Jonesia quinghaiensis TaxID=262806 RepID=UPI00146A578A|nr:abortive infection family protein [Jonesia quinghaiensis]